MGRKDFLKIPKALVNAVIRARVANIEFQNQLKEYLEKQTGDDSNPTTNEEIRKLEKIELVEELLKALASGADIKIIQDRLQLSEPPDLEILGFPENFCQGLSRK
jgi:hypothetical protein